MQLELLGRMVLTDPSERQADCDLPHYSVGISDQSGATASYPVTEPECTTQPHVSFADFQPVQNTFGCEPWPSRVFTTDPEYAVPVGPSRCEYRFYPSRVEGAAAWTRFQLPGGSCQIIVTGIALDVTLYDLDGAQPLASMTTPIAEDVSTALQYEFAAAGEYRVHFQAVDPADATPGGIRFTCE
jgi:hypothetical protein